VRERLLHHDEVGLLRRAMETAGFPEALAGGTWVVFVETEPGSRDSMVRSYLEEAGDLQEHGARVVGLTMEPFAAPEGVVTLPFPLGIVGTDVLEGLGSSENGAGGTGISFVVFPDLDAVRLSGAEHPSSHVRRVLDILAARRLGAYRRALNAVPPGDQAIPGSLELGPALRPHRHRSSVRRLDTDRGLVVETGPPEVVAARSAFMAEANRALAEAGHVPLFPTVLAAVTHEEPGWFLVEGVGPPLAASVFQDGSRARLSPSGLSSIGDAIASLAGLHEVTASQGSLDEGRPSLHAVDIAEGLSRSFGPDIDAGRLLEARVVLGEGPPWRCLGDHLAWLGSPDDDPPGTRRSSLHGEAHLEQAFMGRQGVVFLEPRVDAEMGPIRGDPIEELATFLTSVRPLAAVERAMALGEAESLVALEEGRGPEGPTLRVSDLHPRIPSLHRPDPLTELVRARVPILCREPSWEARFHRASALGLVGLLAGPRAIRPPAAWLAVFLWALSHLERARGSEEGGLRDVRDD
jgi:hypothetical protein